MKLLCEAPSKAQELEHWKDFLNTLPSYSYLAQFLEGSTAVLQEAMAQDWSCEPFRQLRRMRLEALAEISEAIKARDKERSVLDALRKEVGQLRKETCRLRSELEDASRALSTLASAAAQTFHKAQGLCLDQSFIQARSY